MNDDEKKALKEKIEKYYPRLAEITEEIDKLLNEGFKISEDNGIPWNLNGEFESIRRLADLESWRTVYVPESWHHSNSDMNDFPSPINRFKFEDVDYCLWVPSQYC